MHRIASVLIATVFLGACASSGDDEGSSRTSSGQYLGNAEWQDRHPEDLRLDMPREPEIDIVASRARTLPKRYQEYIAVDKGFYRLETLTGRQAFRRTKSENEIVQIAKSINTRAFGVAGDLAKSFSESDIRTDGRIQYAVFEIDNRPCSIMTKALGSRVGRGYKSSLLAFHCGSVFKDLEKYQQDQLLYVRGIETR